MDMDNNKYPDILVGSLDDRIALLRLVIKYLVACCIRSCAEMNVADNKQIINCGNVRSRPVIHLSRNFTVEPKIVDPSLCTDTWLDSFNIFGFFY